MTGAPKSSAVRAIAVEEPHRAGAYTGAAGLITVDGRAELSVLIRTFEASGGRVELGVGGGITVDSVPVREWQECLHKAEPLARAAGQPAGRRPGRPARPGSSRAARSGGVRDHPRPARPTAPAGRPPRAAGALGPGAVRPGPAPRPGRPGRRRWPGRRRGAPRSAVRRARQSRPAAGLDVSVTSRTLGPRLETCTLALATRSAVSWRHKWADRTELPGRRGADRTRPPLLPRPAGSGWPRRAAGNLFVQGADGVWRTPPAGEHVLPGVTRRALLDELGDRGVRGRDRAGERRRPRDGPGGGAGPAA